MQKYKIYYRWRSFSNYLIYIDEVVISCEKIVFSCSAKAVSRKILFIFIVLTAGGTYVFINYENIKEHVPFLSTIRPSTKASVDGGDTKKDSRHQSTTQNAKADF